MYRFMNKAGSIDLKSEFQNRGVCHRCEGVANAKRLTTESPEPKIVCGRVNFHMVWKILLLFCVSSEVVA